MSETAKILVVEDESIVSLEIQGRLEELGYGVAGAVYSGEDAIEFVNEITPDLILMDINLRGDLDGIETSNIIKASHNIPIIYMTAYADDETIERAKVTAPYAYIIKPIEVREMHTSIEIALYKFKIESKLVESEKQFRGLFENATLGLYRTSLDGEILMANNALVKMLGFDSLEDLKNQNDVKTGYINQDKHDEFLEKIQKDRQVVGFESEWRKKDGSIIFVSESATINTDEHGNEVYEGTIENITEKKNAEFALRDSKDILRTIYDSVHDGIIIHDIDGSLLRVNEKVLGFHNISKEDVKNLKFSDLLPDDKICQQLKPLWLEALNGKNQKIEIQLKSSRDSKIHDLEFTISKITIKDKDCLLTTRRDITEEKKAKEDEIKAKELLQKVFDNVHDGIIIHDAGGNIIKVNKKILDYHGITNEEIEKMNLNDITNNPAMVEQTRDIWLKVLDGENIVFETTNTPLNNSTQHDFEIYLTQISIVDKSYILANLRDITEKNKTRDEIIRAKDNAERANRLKSEFLASMSHEIRTPVNTILSYSSLLKDELTEMGFKQFSDFFHSISFGGKRLIRTVDSILNMSQIQTGTFDLSMQNINLDDDILLPLYTEFKVEADNKGLKFLIEKNVGSHVVKGDSYSLGQLFTNLIDNAIKYTNQGEVKIKVFSNGRNTVCVDICDTGIGISDEFQETIFEPFTQESQGYTRRFDGNGLGLALVKKYSDLNNAEVSIKSKKGEGSTFSVKFSQ